jgi:hypothetical protein
MELRNHPRMLSGRYSWPPTWANTNADKGNTLRGEIGVLTGAYKTGPLESICFLVMEHDCDTYIAALMLDNAAFVSHICALLNQNIGRPMSEIGSLEVSDFLGKTVRFSAMKLRDHPLMSHRGVPNWPPIWTHGQGKRVKIVRGEVGVLRLVCSNPSYCTRCYLIIDYEGQKYVGTLIFDSKKFCQQITEFLKLNIRKTIIEIGDLDISFTL